MNKIKIFLLSSLLCLVISSFAQNDAELTHTQKGEYLMKIMMMDLTLDNERLLPIRKAIYSAIRDQEQIVNDAAGRMNPQIQVMLDQVQADRDLTIQKSLSEEEFEYYEDLVFNLNARIYKLKESKK